MMRKVVQIAATFDSGDGGGESRPSYQPRTDLFALCDDGTLWNMPMLMSGGWVQIEPIPQPEPARPYDCCPVCGGDCAGANPPVTYCPMRDGAATGGGRG